MEGCKEDMDCRKWKWRVVRKPQDLKEDMEDLSTVGGHQHWSAEDWTQQDLGVEGLGAAGFRVQQD